MCMGKFHTTGPNLREQRTTTPGEGEDLPGLCAVSAGIL